MMVPIEQITYRLKIQNEIWRASHIDKIYYPDNFDNSWFAIEKRDIDEKT